MRIVSVVHAGRPADVLVLNDGSVLVSDDQVSLRELCVCLCPPQICMCVYHMQMGLDGMYSTVWHCRTSNVPLSLSAAGWGSVPGDVPGTVISATSNTGYSRQTPTSLQLDNNRCHAVDNLRIEVHFTLLSSMHVKLPFQNHASEQRLVTRNCPVSCIEFLDRR